MLLTTKQLSELLSIKPSTLYSWANQAKIPCRKIHGLIRFEEEEIHHWLASFTPAHPAAFPSFRPPKAQSDVESLIAAAKGDVYTSRRETRPREKKGVSPDGSV
ncbi:MAG: helix-turn-helix domain-containing protein [Nitrospirae bacterium]|nr:helix-turn-helix domain-containing protein [Nitrospirota bacterium]